LVRSEGLNFQAIASLQDCGIISDMGNKDSRRREIKKPKKKIPKPTAAPAASVVRQAPTRP
jgi:hypothetical protein